MVDDQKTKINLEMLFVDNITNQVLVSLSILYEIALHVEDPLRNAIRSISSDGLPEIIVIYIKFNQLHVITTVICLIGNVRFSNSNSMSDCTHFRLL